ncbi:MAG: hypothetical protein ACREJQ_02205 [bacterium]
MSLRNISILAGIVGLAAVVFLIVSYQKVTQLKETRQGLETELASLKNNLDLLETDFHDLQMKKLELRQTELTDLRAAEVDYSHFVDMLRSKRITVQAAQAPTIIQAESEDLKTDFPIAMAEVEVYQEVTIKQIIDLMELVADDPHFIRLDLIDVGGGKAVPSYKLAFHMLYGIKTETGTAPAENAAPGPVPPKPLMPPQGGRT